VNATAERHAALRAQIAILDQVLAGVRAARQERTSAWYAAQFNAQEAERKTSLTVIHGRTEP
jgi:hypothetical protein